MNTPIAITRGISLSQPGSVHANLLLKCLEHVRAVACRNTGRPPDQIDIATPRTRELAPTPQPVSGSGAPSSQSEDPQIVNNLGILKVRESCGYSL